MPVIYFQLFIVFTIIVSRVFGKRFNRNICIVWSIFTLLEVFLPALMVIQLCVIWGTYLLLSNVLNQKGSTADLRAEDPAVVDIRDDDHRKELLSALSGAKGKLAILSAYVSDSVIDDEFIGELRAALARGVIVYIGFGYQDPLTKKHQLSRPAMAAICKLRPIMKQYERNLFVAKFENHQKRLVQDDNFVITGSNNWLSNSKFSNLEHSQKVFSKKLASTQMVEIENLVRKHMEKGSILNEENEAATKNARTLNQ